LTAFADVIGEPLGVEGVVQPGKPFTFHSTAVLAVHTPDFHFQVNTQVSARLVAHQPGLVVVKGPRNLSTGSTNRFFPRRRREMIRAHRSPNNPLSVIRGGEPGNR